MNAAYHVLKKIKDWKGFLTLTRITTILNRNLHELKKSLLLLHHHQPVDEFDEVLCNETVGDLKLRSFKLSAYDVGLLFIYFENDGFSRPKVMGEYSIKTDFDHEMLNGTILSHWHRKFI